jgi:hypothetical protein
MTTTKRAGPKVRPKSIGPGWRKYTLLGKTKQVPAEIQRYCDLPHLQNDGQWNARDGQPKRRMEFYLGWLRSLGMSEIDAHLMMSNLYWDCWTELVASGRDIEEFSPLWEPTTSSWTHGVMRHAIQRGCGAKQ